MTTNNSNEKNFLTYNQQMRKLRDDKQIICNGSIHKRTLVRAGYFNLINGYKNPFISGVDTNGNHIYIPNTSIDQILSVKLFDESLRSFLLKYITQVEEEVRTLTGYKFDDCNDGGKIPWYDTAAFSSKSSLQQKMGTISKAYTELSRSKLEYVEFYKNNHSKIPTWIMLKVVNFSTFINVLAYSKTSVKHSICELYGLTQTRNSKTFPNVKLLIGSLHWMRKIRNACAHNERIYCLSRPKGRILETYLRQLRRTYSRNKDQKLFDLIVYFKYYLPHKEYQSFISELKSMIFALKSDIDPIAFDNIRGQMGIVNLSDLDTLVALSKDDIEYNKFDKK
ncbi:MAG: Abi family protein [Lachnospiraceae bacterium]|nr:Abi family protein [Lachnospiraceae bacterium]